MSTEDAQAAEKVALTDAEPCCEHSLSWHHETRGCGYHGFSRNRCPCLLPFDEALTLFVAARVAEAVDRERAAWVAKVIEVASEWERKADEDAASDENLRLWAAVQRSFATALRARLLPAQEES